MAAVPIAGAVSTTTARRRRMTKLMSRHRRQLLRDAADGAAAAAGGAAAGAGHFRLSTPAMENATADPGWWCRSTCGRSPTYPGWVTGLDSWTPTKNLRNRHVNTRTTTFHRYINIMVLTVIVVYYIIINNVIAII